MNREDVLQNTRFVETTTDRTIKIGHSVWNTVAIEGKVQIGRPRARFIDTIKGELSPGERSSVAEEVYMRPTNDRLPAHQSHS